MLFSRRLGRAALGRGEGAMPRNRMTGWIVPAALLAALPATAETFYSQDGVVFEGTIRRVVSNASVCNVLEEKYTPDEYERL